jgi:hypothetical protein
MKIWKDNEKNDNNNNENNMCHSIIILIIK